MAHINKIYRLIQNTLKITFPEKKVIQCKNVICIIKNLETNFIRDIIMNSRNNIINQLNN